MTIDWATIGFANPIVAHVTVDFTLGFSPLGPTPKHPIDACYDTLAFGLHGAYWNAPHAWDSRPYPA